MDLPEQDFDKEDDAIQAVQEWLQENGDWLLIFDSADNPEIIKTYRPSHISGHILLTSRAQVFDRLGVAKPLMMELLSIDEAVEFLLKRTARDDSDTAEIEAATQLATELGCLPLAIEQAGAYLIENMTKFEDYLVSYRKYRVELLDESQPKTGEHESVTATWTINFQQVEKESEAAADLLRFTAFLSPEDIPSELIRSGAPHLGAAISLALAEVDENPLCINRILEPLTRYSLMKRELNTGNCSIHRLVQEVIKTTMDTDTRGMWARRTVLAINESFPTAEFENWPCCDRILPHAIAAAGLVDYWTLDMPEAHTLYTKIALYFHRRGRYTKAEFFYNRGLIIGEKVLDPDDVDLAVTANNLASLYYRQYRFLEAEELYKRALAVKERVLGKEHPSVATTLNDLAGLYLRSSDFARAKQLYFRALTIREKEFGKAHPDVAQSFNDLAILYYHQGNYGKAKTLFREALAIREKLLGRDNPDIAITLKCLALIHRIEGRFREAETLFQRTLQIEENALGMDHPDVAETINALALLYRSQGRHADAEHLFQKALAIYEKSLGQDHPDVAMVLNSLAILYHGQGRYSEAATMCERALGIRETVLGNEHPDVAASTYTLATIRCAQHRFDESLRLCQRALTTIRARLGENHPEVASTLATLAAIYRQTGQSDIAETTLREARSIYEKLFGIDHPEIAAIDDELTILSQEKVGP